MADSYPTINVVADDMAYFQVMVDGNVFSEHTTLHVAIENAVNQSFSNPGSKVNIVRTATWIVETNIPTNNDGDTGDGDTDGGGDTVGDGVFQIPDNARIIHPEPGVQLFPESGTAEEPLVYMPPEGQSYVELPNIFSKGNISHVWFVGLSLTDINILARDGAIDNIYIIDCKVTNPNGDGIAVQARNEYAMDNVTISRCVVTDCRDGSRSQGIYGSGINGLNIINNVFDNNGDPNIYSHNIYLSETCSNVTIADNIISNGGSMGVKSMCSSTVNNNVFWRNSIAIEGKVPASTYKVVDNLILASTDIDADTPRSNGININGLSTAVIAGNRLADPVGQTGESIKLLTGDGGDGSNIEVFNNTIWNWDRYDALNSDWHDNTFLSDDRLDYSVIQQAIDYHRNRNMGEWDDTLDSKALLSTIRS